jgi:hypothetical protein
MGRNKQKIKERMKVTDLSEEAPSLLRADPVMETFAFKANMKRGDLTAGMDLTANTQQGSVVNTALAVFLVCLAFLATWAGVAGIAAWVGLGAVACVSVGSACGFAVLVGGGYLVYRSTSSRKELGGK